MLKRTDKAEGLTAAATATDPNTGSQTQLGWMPELRLRLDRIVEPRLVVPQQIVASHNEWTCARPMPSRCNWIKNTAYVVSFDNGKQILTSLRPTVSINALDSHDGRGAQTRTLKPNPVAPFFPDSSR